MTMIVGKIELDFEPGDTYEDTRRQGRSKEEMRQEAIKQFRDAAQNTTRAQLTQCIGAALALVIQLRGLGGSDRKLANSLREAADFLEDL